MPDETPTTQTQTSTASPQGTQPATQQPTQTASSFIERITAQAQAFPDGRLLPATREQADKIEKQQAEAAAKTQAQTPEAQPTQTTNVDDSETPPAELSEKGKENWKKWKAAEKVKLQEWENKWKAANTELETLKKTPQTKVEVKAPDDYEDLKKREAEYSDRLKLLDLQNHPQFKQHFESKYEGVFNTVKLIGGKDGDKLVELLKQPESELKTQQLEEVFSKISPLYQSQLGAAFLKMKEIDAEKAMELSKGKDNYSKVIAMQQENQRKQQEQAAAQANRVFEEQLQSARKELHIFQKKDGDEAWNKQVDSFEKTARDIYTGNLPLPELARAAQWSAAAPLFLQDADAKATEIANLKAELGRLKAVQPKPGSGTDPKEPQMPANMSLSERIVWQAQQAGAVR